MGLLRIRNPGADTDVVGRKTALSPWRGEKVGEERYTMRYAALGLCLITGVITGSSCRHSERDRQPPVAAGAARSSSLPRPGEVLTAGEMERLRQERKSMIERPSPLGEEVDAVGAVQGRRRGPGK
jgi:hypothetical protein